jgi:hypothetical protein
MTPPPVTNLYKRHRFPAEIISHCVWLYFRFCLSYRDVKELMAERGVILTYEGSEANGIQLGSKWVLHQGLTQCTTCFCHEGEGFGPPLFDPGLDTIGPYGIDE